MDVLESFCQKIDVCLYVTKTVFVPNLECNFGCLQFFHQNVSRGAFKVSVPSYFYGIKARRVSIPKLFKLEGFFFNPNFDVSRIIGE